MIYERIGVLAAVAIALAAVLAYSLWGSFMLRSQQSGAFSQSAASAVATTQ